MNKQLSNLMRLKTTQSLKTAGKSLGKFGTLALPMVGYMGVTMAMPGMNRRPSMNMGMSPFGKARTLHKGPVPMKGLQFGKMNRRKFGR